MHLSNPPQKKQETQTFRYISTGDQFVFLSPSRLFTPLQSCADRSSNMADRTASAGLQQGKQGGMGQAI